jgi:hypothetical protein
MAPTSDTTPAIGRTDPRDRRTRMPATDGRRSTQRRVGGTPRLPVRSARGFAGRAAGEVVWMDCERQVTHQGPGPRPGRSTEFGRRSDRRRWLMATHVPHSRSALRLVFDRPLPGGGRWQEIRRSSNQLGRLRAWWPPGRGASVRLTIGLAERPACRRSGGTDCHGWSVAWRRHPPARPAGTPPLLRSRTAARLGE